MLLLLFTKYSTSFYIFFLHVCCCNCCGNVYILFLNLFTRYWVSARCMSSSSTSSLPRSNRSSISATPSHPLLVCECMTAFCNLVPMPLPDFILQLWRKIGLRDKIWEWPENETMYSVHEIASHPSENAFL